MSLGDLSVVIAFSPWAWRWSWAAVARYAAPRHGERAAREEIGSAFTN
jgi:hypothetical protein